MTWSIRSATLEDAETVIEFNSRLAQESEGKKLDPALIGPGVKSALSDRNKALNFLAEEEGKTLGQIMITYEWSDWRNGWIWWIQSVFVRAEARRRGVFRSLFKHVAAEAQKDPAVVALRLYVDEDNDNAQETYRRLGMNKTTYFVMEMYPLS